MIDINHPQSEHIFDAARCEDFLLQHAKRMTIANVTARTALFKECEPILFRMQKLNDEHFGASVLIASAIEELRRCLTSLVELDGNNSADEKNLSAGCPACGAALVDRVPRPWMEREIYCRECLEIIMPALQRLRSGHGFGTDAI